MREFMNHFSVLIFLGLVCCSNGIDQAYGSTINIDAERYDSSQYWLSKERRLASLRKLLDTTRFDGIVMGTIGPNDIELQHSQDLETWLGVNNLVSLWTAIVDNEKQQRVKEGKKSYEPSTDILDSSFSQNWNFNLFLRSNYPRISMMAAVKDSVEFSGPVAIRQDQIIDFVYGTFTYRIPCQIFLLPTKHSPYLRLLVLGFFNKDTCFAAACLPI